MSIWVCFVNIFEFTFGYCTATCEVLRSFCHNFIVNPIYVLFLVTQGINCSFNLFFFFQNQAWHCTLSCLLYIVKPYTTIHQFIPPVNIENFRWVQAWHRVRYSMFWQNGTKLIRKLEKHFRRKSNYLSIKTGFDS